MRIKTSINYFSLVAFIFTTTCISCTDKDSEKSTQKGFLSESRLANEAGALEVATSLDDTFKSLLKSTDCLQAYPDYFGGATITDEGTLLILVKGDTIKAKEDLISRAKSNNFTIKSCQYSLNELSKLKLGLADYFHQEQYRKELGWVAVGIRPSENKVFVRLKECSPQKIEEFKSKISDSDAIIFEFGEEVSSDSAPLPEGISVNRVSYNINPGSQFTVLDKSGSVGYRARYAGYEGFVTAGHCIPKIAGIAYHSGNYAGDGKIYQLGPKVDAAFVQTKTTFSVTSNTQFGHYDLSSTIISLSFLDAAAVSMEGFKTAKASHGVVEGVDVSVAMTQNMPYLGTKTYTVDYLMEASFSGQGGDSGGIVYGSVNKQIAGCYSGHSSTHRYFSYAGYINDLFKLTIY